MSSWLNRAAIRPRKIVPDGKFIQKEKPATVVSAYYEMKSKHNLHDYRTWIELFLKNIPCYLIFFTEANLYDFIKECRVGYEDRTRIIILPREQWVANTYSQDIWNSLYAKDPEKNIHNPELYKVWFEKCEFVMRGIKLNPYDHDDFLWVDAGICRKKSIMEMIKTFPVASRIPTDKILVLNVMPFSQADKKVSIINGVSFIGGGIAKDRIAAGIIAGNKEIWQQYKDAFYTVHKKFIDANLFWGKEQDLMKSMVLENINLFSLIQIRPIIPEKWFYSLIYLGCSDNLYKRLLDEERNKEVKSFESLRET